MLDHHVVFFSITKTGLPQPNETVSTRKFKKLNIIDFKEDVKSCVTELIEPENSFKHTMHQSVDW